MSQTLEKWDFHVLCGPETLEKWDSHVLSGPDF